MKTKTDYVWQLFPDTCPLCSGPAEVFRRDGGRSIYNAGLSARCYTCHHEGTVSADCGEAYIEWDDE